MSARDELPPCVAPAELRHFDGRETAAIAFAPGGCALLLDLNQLGPDLIRVARPVMFRTSRRTILSQ